MTPDAQLVAAEGAVELQGLYDINRAHEFHGLALTLAARTDDLILDGSRVERMDTSAAQILLALKKEVESAGRRFELRNLPRNVLSFFECIGLDAVFTTNTGDSPQ